MRMRRYEILEGGVQIEQDFTSAQAILRQLSQQSHSVSGQAGTSLGGG
jgi:hypothetical protein